MRLTSGLVAEFESDQGAFGTKIALSNLLWRAAAEQLNDLGIKNVRTTYTSKREAR